MKPVSSHLRILLLAFAAVITAAAIPGASAAEGGRLMIKHSPILGLNVAVGVTIDGKNAGAFTKGHTFEQVLTPGRHVITAFANGRQWDARQLVVNVRSGQTYAYQAVYRDDRIVLDPVTKPR